MSESVISAVCGGGLHPDDVAAVLYGADNVIARTGHGSYTFAIVNAERFSDGIAVLTLDEIARREEPS